MPKIELDIKNCLDCPHHEVRPDPDPLDSFCQDDQKVVCKKAKNERAIVVAERPYNLRRECKVPSWCPLLTRKKRAKG